METYTDLVLATTRHTTGVIELNRPQALNSLNVDMFETLDSVLERWAGDDRIHRVIIRSTSSRAFCAGGDMKLVREHAVRGDHDFGDYGLAREYDMNELLACYAKSVVALIDGLNMGGGLGVSVHGSHRVVTERAWMSMPEMAIGFVPDTGVTYMTQRMRGEYGPSPALAKFIGLTGYRMTPADCLWSGLATDFVHSTDIDAFADMMISESLDEAREKFVDNSAAGTSRVAGMIDSIEACFSGATWKDIDNALSSHGDAEFVDYVRDLQSNANPASLVAATALYTANEQVDDIRDALDNEFAVGALLRREPNFAEGVRAVLVDKDRAASFAPASTDDVDPAPYLEALARTGVA